MTGLPSKCCLLVTWHQCFIRHLPQHYQIGEKYSNIATPLSATQYWPLHSLLHSHWHLKPPTRGISCLSLVLYGIRVASMHRNDLLEAHFLYYRASNRTKHRYWMENTGCGYEPGLVEAPVWGRNNDVSWSDYVNICPQAPTVILHWDDQRQTIIFSYEYSIWTLAWSPVLSPSLDWKLSRPGRWERFYWNWAARVISREARPGPALAGIDHHRYHALNLSGNSNKQPQACLGIYQDYNESESQ